MVSPPGAFSGHQKAAARKQWGGELTAEPVTSSESEGAHSARGELWGPSVFTLLTTSNNPDLAGLSKFSGPNHFSISNPFTVITWFKNGVRVDLEPFVQAAG